MWWAAASRAVWLGTAGSKRGEGAFWGDRQSQVREVVWLGGPRQARRANAQRLLVVVRSRMKGTRQAGSSTSSSRTRALQSWNAADDGNRGALMGR